MRGASDASRCVGEPSGAFPRCVHDILDTVEGRIAPCYQHVPTAIRDRRDRCEAIDGLIGPFFRRTAVVVWLAVVQNTTEPSGLERDTPTRRWL